MSRYCDPCATYTPLLCAECGRLVDATAGYHINKLNHQSAGIAAGTLEQCKEAHASMSAHQVRATGFPSLSGLGSRQSLLFDQVSNRGSVSFGIRWLACSSEIFLLAAQFGHHVLEHLSMIDLMIADSREKSFEILVL